MAIESALGDYSTALTPQQFGAVGDGSSHPVSDYFADHLQARNYYSSRFGISDVSFITSASQEIDEVGIQAAINSLPANGGTVRIPAGTYKLTNGLSTNQVNLELVGEGGPGLWSAVGLGATRLTLSGAIVGFTFNSAASSTNFRGPALRNLAFVCDSSSTGGILIKRSNNYVLENVTVTGATAGYGIKHDGTGDASTWWLMWNVNVANCQIGQDFVHAGGRGFGCFWDGNANGTSPTAGTTGVRLRSSSTLRLFGSGLHGWEKAWDQDTGEGAVLSDVTFETFTTAITLTNTTAFQHLGGTINNSQAGGTGTAYSVDSGCVRTILMPSEIVSVTTKISDSATDTFLLRAAHLQLSANTYAEDDGSAIWRFFTHLRVQGALVANYGNAASAPLQFGSGPACGIYYGTGTPEGAKAANVGSLFLRTDGGASTTLYVKESGTGNTGWVAK